jgi:hypothetical protein
LQFSEERHKGDVDITQLLANFSPLPLPVIGGHCGLDAEAASAGGGKSPEELELAVRQIVSRAISSD